MSDDLDLFRKETAEWLEANCPAAMRQPITEDSVLWSGSRMRFISADQQIWFERMRDKGWFAPAWPAEYGGGGLDPKRARIVEQEMARLKCRAPVFLGHPVFAQALRKILCMCHRFDALGVDGLHGFDQGEYSVQVAERGLRFGVADFDPGKMRDAPDLFQGERHGIENS